MVATLPLEAMTTPAPASSTLAPTSGLSLRISSPDDLQRLARLFSASGLFGRATGNPEAHMAECAIKILAGMEAGFGSFASIAGVSVINGRPGFGANLLAQAIKRHPLYDYRVLEKTDQVCRIKFLSGKEELGIETFTIQMADRANLIGKGGPWKQYPEAMLFARCLTAGMRTHCPDALGGVAAYTPEELGARGQIDENGVVVVEVDATYEEALPPPKESLAAAAGVNCERAGMTEAGLQAFLAYLNAATLAEVPRNLLQALATRGPKPETVERFNLVGEHGDELQATYETKPQPAAAAT